MTVLCDVGCSLTRIGMYCDIINKFWGLCCFVQNCGIPSRLLLFYRTNIWYHMIMYWIWGHGKWAMCRQCWMMTGYPLVNVYIANWKDPPLLMGKLTISMAMFNSYVAVYQRVHISIWKSMNPHPTSRTAMEGGHVWSHPKWSIWIDKTW